MDDHYVIENRRWQQAGLSRIMVHSDDVSKPWGCDKAIKWSPRSNTKSLSEWQLKQPSLSLSWVDQLSSGATPPLQTASHSKLGLFPLSHASLLSYGEALRAASVRKASWEDRETSRMQVTAKFFLNCLQSSNFRDTSVILSIQSLFYNIADKHV